VSTSNSNPALLIGLLESDCGKRKKTLIGILRTSWENHL